MQNENILDQISPLDRVTYASFGDRLLSTLLDLVVLIPLIGLNFYNTYYLKSLPVALLIVIIGFLYKPLLEWAYGATPGKMIMKLKVVNEQLEFPSISEAFTRFSIYALMQIVGLMTTVWLFGQEAFYQAQSFMEVGLIQQDAPAAYQYVNIALSLLVIVAILMMLGSSRKQTLYDQWAKLYVVHQRSLPKDDQV